MKRTIRDAEERGYTVDPVFALGFAPYIFGEATGAG
jgi:hypothetical protein